MDASTSRPEHDTRQPGVFEEEFARFFLEMAPRLMRFLVIRGLTSESAQDIVQEVMFKLFRRWDRVENREAWVFAVAANEARDFYRQNLRNREVLVPVDEDVDAATHDPIAWKAEAIDTLTALRSLPLRQQEVAVFYFMEDLSVTQIAEIMGVSVRGVHRHLHAAKENLKKQLQITSGTRSQPSASS